MKKVLFILFVCVGLISCNKEVKNQTTIIENKYSMELPDYLTKTSSLNSEASLQYKNEMKELYVVVIDEPISGFQEALELNNLTEDYKNDLNGYSSIILDTFKENVDVTYVSDPKETTINGLPTILFEVKAKINGYVAYYHFAYLQGKENYYQVLTWTLDTKESEHKEKMEAIVNSFKEL